MSQVLNTKTDHIYLKVSSKWKTCDTESTVAVIGYAFLKDRYLGAEALADLFSKETVLDFKRLTALTKELNGNFAVIVRSAGSLFAFVDKTRSYPLFYHLNDGKLCIGDDISSMKNAAGDIRVDAQAREEYLMSGYVSGSATLYGEIKGLQAGECLEAKFDEKGICGDIVTKRYYIYHNTDKKQLPPEPMISSHDQILKNIFERTAESANGRKLVIPLSGGIDSRLVASMFKRIGYKNILCISYGVPGNWETKISQKVAEKLGYEWLFIPYTLKKWNDISKSIEWREFFYSLDNISSIPNINEWLAVSELKKNHSVPRDAIFVPGHTGDFISGGHIHYVFDEKAGDIIIDGLLERMLKKHYALWPSMLKKPEIKKRILHNLSKSIKDFKLNSAQSIIDAYEYWEWQERQAKFIINSVRIYDFWGYEWRIPLWDSELMDFWSAIPYELKLRKKLYLAYLEKTDKFGVFGNSLRRNKLYRKRILPDAMRKFIEYFKDTKAIYGMHGYFVATLLNLGKRNINSILVKDYLGFFRNNSSKMTK